jgi:hypothetical protein
MKQFRTLAEGAATYPEPRCHRCSIAPRIPLSSPPCT